MTQKIRYPVLWAMLASGGCVIEKIDAIIAEHGVTYWPSSTGDEAGAGGSSTTTSTSTSSTGDAAGSSDETSSQAASEVTPGTDSSEGASSSSTGPVEPVCGNGVVEGEETCDDGNTAPNDGCKECAKDLIVFISSEVYRGYDLGGLAGADQRCRSLAAKAGLPRPETFRAWLSTPMVPAADRITHSRGRYVLVNGLAIAEDWASLTSGTLNTTITVDENSQTQDSRAWTGTLASGQPALGSEFCSDWDDDSGLIFYGGAGRSLAVDSGWSFFSHDECGGQNRLYCLEN